jgi:hypothetical protein
MLSHSVRSSSSSSDFPSFVFSFNDDDAASSQFHGTSRPVRAAGVGPKAAAAKAACEEATFLSEVYQISENAH